MGDLRTHAQWFADKGWPDDTIQACTRGYYTADEVYLYKGLDFVADDEVILHALKIRGNLKRQRCPSGLPIFVGRTLLATLGHVPHKLQVATTL